MRENKGYNTRPLRLISEILSLHKGEHITAEQIFSEIQARGESVGLTTIYRNLEKLCGEGVAQKYQGDGCACFGLADSCRHHFHPQCSRCGRLTHIECDYIDKLSAHVSEHHGFSVDSSKTVLHGVCGECAK